MKKDIIKIIIKVLIYALGLIGTYFGVSAMTSCTASHQIDGYGKTTVVTVDTTYVKHFGYLKTR